MMDRLQKKCILASTTFHAGLLMKLLFGSALRPSPAETATFMPISVYTAD